MKVDQVIGRDEKVLGTLPVGWTYTPPSCSNVSQARMTVLEHPDSGPANKIINYRKKEFGKEAVGQLSTYKATIFDIPDLPTLAAGVRELDEERCLIFGHVPEIESGRNFFLVSSKTLCTILGVKHEESYPPIGLYTDTDGLVWVTRLSENFAPSTFKLFAHDVSDGRNTIRCKGAPKTTFQF